MFCRKLKGAADYKENSHALNYLIIVLGNKKCSHADMYNEIVLSITIEKKVNVFCWINVHNCKRL